MTTLELYLLIKKFYGNKLSDIYLSEEDKEVTCTLYSSFVFKCNLKDEYGRFSGGIILSEENVITSFLGEELSLNSDEKSIQSNLEIVDTYCRMRLPNKFLEAHDKMKNN